jgi:hypothetical protein
MLPNRERIIDLAWLLCWGALSTVWCWSAGHTLGSTYDEQFYVQAGLKNWHEFNHRELLRQGTMPLAPEVQTLPVRVAEWWLSIDATADWLDWLPLARLGTLLFWWLLLWASLRLGSLYGGPVAGRFALALTACEPLLLGHASLATTDIAFTACLLGLIVVFRGRRELPDWRGRLLLPAAWVMLSFMAKASALVFVPAALGMIELERLWSAGWRPGWQRAEWTPALASLRDLVVIGLLGMVMLFAVCPRATTGLLFQIRHNAGGHGMTYLFEQVSLKGFWYYFPAALAVKLALPVLLLITLLLLVRPRALLNGPFWAVIGLLALTPMFKVQIGVRFVLPIAALVIVAASIGFARWYAQQPGMRRAIAGGFASALVLWSLTSACLVWPHGICYTNELFGGTSEGFSALSDSNYDWGQGVPELADWQRDHDDAPLHLWYFGTDPRAQVAPFYSIMPGVPAAMSDGEDLARRCQGGYLAVSTTWIYGYFYTTPAAQHLRALQPCGRTTTFLIYDFRK